MTELLSAASVFKSIGGVALAVLILLAMVTIHEFGHYIAGKLLQFKINEFSVGFGPALLKKRSKKTGELFSLRAIPLGGYCAFDGEDEPEEPTKKTDDLAEAEKEGKEEKEYPEPQGARFNDQAPWKRILVLVAGATMNYLLALFLLILMFASVGRPLYKVIDPPAESSFQGEQTALVADDVLLEIEGKNLYLITDYMTALDGKKQGDTVSVTLLRDGQEITVEMRLFGDADFANMSDTRTLLRAMGIYGLSPVSMRQGFFSTIGHSAAYSVKIGGVVLRSLGELCTGKLGLDAVGGPVTTIKVTSEVASSGWASFLNIAAFIGVNLAVFNLLPIPALDGCKVIFCIIEWIRKKPVNRKVEAIINLVGIAFLFGFAILVDLLQLF